MHSVLSAHRQQDHLTMRLHMVTSGPWQNTSPRVDANIAVEEWMSFREHVVSGALKVSHQVLILLGLFFQLGSTNMKPHVVILCLAL